VPEATDEFVTNRYNSSFDKTLEDRDLCIESNGPKFQHKSLGFAFWVQDRIETCFGYKIGLKLVLGTRSD